MKITHISLCGIVTDRFTYQDNILPKYHKILGNEVSMITSKYIWDTDGKIKVDPRVNYINEYGIKTIRLESKFNSTYKSKFKFYKKLYKTLEDEAPDILFIHGSQFPDIKIIEKYIKSNPHITVYIDNHADYANSASNWISYNILHKIIWRYFAKTIEPYVYKYYGVLPSRVNFLIDMYKINPQKVELLIMGGDDEKIASYNNNYTRNTIRNKFKIEKSDFLIVTGGKIDSNKREIFNLIEAVKKIKDENIKLLIFGSVNDDIKKEFLDKTTHESISYIGWIDDNQSYQMFAAADILIFPSGHSVYWEQGVSMGKPLIVKYFEGAMHIDFGGNCIFLYEDSVNEIYKNLLSLINGSERYKQLLKLANTEGKEQFFYSRIAKFSILMKD